MFSNNLFLFTKSVIYWAAGGLGWEGENWIYPFLKWDDPGPTLLFLFVCFLLMFPLHLIVWGLHVLRDYIYKKCFEKETISIGAVHENVVYSDKEE